MRYGRGGSATTLNPGLCLHKAGPFFGVGGDGVGLVPLSSYLSLYI